VLCDYRLGRGDGGGCRRWAVARAQRALEEEEPEAAVPCVGVGRQGERGSRGGCVGAAAVAGGDGEDVAADLEEVADEGVARAALEPDEQRHGGRRGHQPGGLEPVR
jgi:hypothetical protein